VGQRTDHGELPGLFAAPAFPVIIGHRGRSYRPLQRWARTLPSRLPTFKGRLDIARASPSPATSDRRIRGDRSDGPPASSREAHIQPPPPSLHGFRAVLSPQRLLVALLGAFALILPFLASLPTLDVLAAILIVAGILLVIAFRGQPQVLIAVVAVLAWASRPTLQILDVNIRVEQPILGMLLVIVVVNHRDAATAIIRRAWPLAAGLAIWLGADVASSLFVAPDAVLSLRIVVWLAMSIGAGWIVSVLATCTDPDRDLRLALVVAGVAEVGAALIALVTGLVFGTSWGGYAIQDGIAVFRAYGLAWEPNIFGSGLAILLPVALDRFLDRRRLIDLSGCALLALGVGMSLTRAVWIALLIGLVAYAVLRVMTSSGSVPIRRATGLMAAGTLSMGILLGIGLTIAATGPSDPLVAQLSQPSLLGAPPSPTVSATTSVSVNPPLDLTDDMTLSFRLERVRRALEDLRASPVVGMGANSYGQRHLHPGEDQPDYLAVFPITVLYDTGIVGLGGLGLFAALFVRMMWRSAQRRDSAPFLASFIVMAIAYVSTDALRFSQSWILMGVALGIALRPPGIQGNAPE
jgi:O-Antigen ligase